MPKLGAPTLMLNTITMNAVTLHFASKSVVSDLTSLHHLSWQSLHPCVSLVSTNVQFTNQRTWISETRKHQKSKLSIVKLPSIVKNQQYIS